MTREPRFPGIDWSCDHCGAFLNTQKNFDDHKYLWKCTACGYKNSISWDSIVYGDSMPTKIILHLLGFISFVGLWTAVMLGIGMFCFNADRNLYLLPFVCCIGACLFSYIVDVLVEHKLRNHKRLSGLTIFFRNLFEDLIAPLFAFKEFISFIFTVIANIFRRAKKPINGAIVFFTVLYLLIICAEVFELSKITGLSVSDWISLIASLQ